MRLPKFSFFVFFSIFFQKKFRNFFLSPKGPLFNFFDILQQTEASKGPKGPPFLVFGTVRLFQNSYFPFFRKFFQCLQRVMSPPFNFFDILQQTGFSKSRKGPPFYKFKNMLIEDLQEIDFTFRMLYLSCLNFHITEDKLLEEN